MFGRRCAEASCTLLRLGWPFRRPHNRWRSAGATKELDELLAMAVASDIKAHIEVLDMTDVEEVMQRLERSEVEGSVVLKISG